MYKAYYQSTTDSRKDEFAEKLYAVLLDYEKLDYDNVPEIEFVNGKLCACYDFGDYTLKLGPNDEGDGNWALISYKLRDAYIEFTPNMSTGSIIARAYLKPGFGETASELGNLGGGRMTVWDFYCWTEEVEDLTSETIERRDAGDPEAYIDD